MIFVDTSAFFALTYDKDPSHSIAKNCLEGLLEESERLVTHNYVIVESLALLHRRLGFSSAKFFYKEVHQLCQILWVSQTQHERAAKAYVSQPGSRFSLVDCVSFELMKTHGIRRWFAFDEDFKRPGFEPVK